MYMRHALVVGALLLTAACGGGDDRVQAGGDITTGAAVAGGVPEEFEAACGRPGARVSVKERAATIRKADCDLTGVSLEAPGYGGAVVPPPGRGVGNSAGFTASTAVNGDVTYQLTGSGDSNG